jgi:hypothetical protein
MLDVAEWDGVFRKKTSLAERRSLKMGAGANLSVIYVCLLFATVPIVFILGAVFHWKTYAAYKLLGDRVSRLGYYWFSAQFQLGSLAQGMPGYVDYLDSLPPDLKTRVLTIRKQALRSVWMSAFWIAFVILFGAVSALIRR